MITGKALRDAIISGANNICNNRKRVDELNVFPVPDGDTGTNMYMSMNNAVLSIKSLDDDVTVSDASDAVASALLRGARGNSGVILSLLFRGFAKGLQGRETANAEDIAHALKFGVEAAYKAVMKPTEGTILTVARLAAEKAEQAAKDDISAAELWRIMLDEANKTLNETPELLPVLKKAGVVDAGGKGLVVIFEGMQSVFDNNIIIERDMPQTGKAEVITESVNAAGEYDGEITFTYCTEFVGNKAPDSKDSLSLRAFLETIGDSVVVVDDDEIIKVHCHTDNPGSALQEGLKFGSLTSMKIENMREQHEERVKEVKMRKEQELPPAEAEKQFGFVAVAAGAGIERLYSDLGVDHVVQGGQTMNPSTEDILKAVNATPSEIVFVLPNNKNIIMAAEQAVDLAHKKMCVLQTRTIPQGIAAMLAFDENADFNRNRLDMTKAIDNVSTGQVTFAARDSDYDGHEIKKGEILALDNGKLSFTERDVTRATYRLARKLVKNDSSFVTLIYGSDVDEDAANVTAEMIQNKLGNNIDVTVINGGQPVYYYIISVE